MIFLIDFAFDREKYVNKPSFKNYIAILKRSPLVYVYCFEWYVCDNCLISFVVHYFKYALQYVVKMCFSQQSSVSLHFPVFA